MRLRLASRFSALILAIFALALLSNLMALFAAWRVEKRLKEIATADVPIADAADEFRTALQEERLLYTTFPPAAPTKPRPPVAPKKPQPLVAPKKPQPLVAPKNRGPRSRVR